MTKAMPETAGTLASFGRLSVVGLCATLVAVIVSQGLSNGSAFDDEGDVSEDGDLGGAVAMTTAIRRAARSAAQHSIAPQESKKGTHAAWSVSTRQAPHAA
jgi:hypothetical protein